MIMTPCGTLSAGEVLEAEWQQHRTINNLLLFDHVGCTFSMCVFLGAPEG